jgi:hypothetical protein
VARATFEVLENKEAGSGTFSALKPLFLDIEHRKSFKSNAGYSPARIWAVRRLREVDGNARDSAVLLPSLKHFRSL